MESFERGVIHPTALVSTQATLGSRVTIGAYSVVHDRAVIGDGSIVGSHCVLGEPPSDFYSEFDPPAPGGCTIGAGAIIRSHSVIYQGAQIGNDLRTGHHVTIRDESKIGDGVQIGTMSDLQGKLMIGNYVRLHSSVFVAQFSAIEDFVWLFPNVVLLNDPHPPSDTCTQGPTVRRYSAVAANSTLMPGIEIGEHALVGAMSLVTRDVPPGAVVVGAPAKPVGPTTDIQCKHDALKQVYPWTAHFRRGYPAGALPEAGADDQVQQRPGGKQ